MKTWKDYAMQVCEERDIECRDEDDLREVFLDYCDPIELIQKLQKEIEELNKYKDLYGKALRVADSQIDEIDDLKEEIDNLREEFGEELAKEKSVVDFYADKINWYSSEHDRDFEIEYRDQVVLNDVEYFKKNTMFGGRLARQRQRERNEKN